MSSKGFLVYFLISLVWVFQFLVGFCLNFRSYLLNLSSWSLRSLSGLSSFWGFRWYCFIFSQIILQLIASWFSVFYLLRVLILRVFYFRIVLIWRCILIVRFWSLYIFRSLVQIIIRFLWPVLHYFAISFIWFHWNFALTIIAL